MKLRYWVGIPYLYLIAVMGGNILFSALLIGILAGFTDNIVGRNDGEGPHYDG